MSPLHRAGAGSVRRIAVSSAPDSFMSSLDCSRFCLAQSIERPMVVGGSSSPTTAGLPQHLFESRVPECHLTAPLRPIAGIKRETRCQRSSSGPGRLPPRCGVERPEVRRARRGGRRSPDLQRSCCTMRVGRVCRHMAHSRGRLRAVPRRSRRRTYKAPARRGELRAYDRLRCTYGCGSPESTPRLPGRDAMGLV